MQKLNPRLEINEKIIKSLLTSVALLSSLLLLGMFLFILRESWPIWSQIGCVKFLTGSVWRPVSPPPQFGIAPMFLSTIWVAGGALLIAAPLGFACAIFLSEFAPAPIAALLRPVLNMLTGIPSVVYGFLGAAVLIKFFEIRFDLATGESLFAASLVLAIMILPFVTTNSEVALRSVGPEYRNAAMSLGISRQYLAIHILLPLARRGMLGSLVLAFGRAMGETMAVLMVAGNTMILPFSWFDKGEPLPALIALELGSSTPGTIHYQALFAAGLVLILMVIAVNFTINLFLRRLRSEVKGS